MLDRNGSHQDNMGSCYFRNEELKQKLRHEISYPLNVSWSLIYLGF